MRLRLPAAVAIPFAAIALAAALGDAHAATSPFGIATPDSPGGAGFGGPLAPLFAQIAAWQREMYKTLVGALGAIKADGTAAWLLLGVSFLYGIFHAAGPGHGKAVIASYLVATGETARRGILISFLSAFLQAASAIAIVTVAAVVFRVTAVTMTRTTDWIEIASYALIALVGAWLLWAKTFGGGHHHHHHGASAGHDHHDDHHDHDHRGHDHHHHDHAHHDHAPPVVAQRGSRGGVISAVVAAGIRPCSGAIIILVFALSQGLFLVGIAATLVMAVGTGLTVAALAVAAVSAKGLAVRLAGVDTPVAARIVRGLEIAAALAVLLFGLLLLGGALAGGLPG